MRKTLARKLSDISSRQDQKLSPAGPPRSAAPAMARWKAWECRLGIPGITGPAARGRLPAALPGWSGDVPVVGDVEAHVPGPALRQQRPLAEQHLHFAPSPVPLSRLVPGD